MTDDSSGIAPSRPFELEEDDRYTVAARAERIAILNRLCSDATLLSVYPDGGADFILTTLLLVDTEGGTLVFEAGRNTATNDRLERAERITFVTEVEGIRVQFKSAAARAVLYGQDPAFQVDIPTSIVRRQRREYFRIAPPVNKPIGVQITLSVMAQTTTLPARGVDISCGGIVLLVEGALCALGLGQILPEVTITLPGIATLKTGLEVRNKSATGRPGRQGTARIGCRFVGLSQANSARIQRYINHLEVERRNRA